MDIILSLLVYVIFISIFLIGIKKKETLSKEECYKCLNGMRGVVALEIVIGHVVRYEASYLMPFGKFMLVGVGFFFFVSGWGLCKSYYEKNNYLDTFFRTRFIYLVGVALVALGVISLVDIISPIKTDYSSYSLEFRIMIRNIFVRTNWYIRELLLLYLAFYFVYKYIKRHQLTILTIITVLISCGLYGLGYVRCWYASILAFPLGFLFYENYSKIVKFLRMKKGMLLIFLLGVVGLSSVLINDNSFVRPFVTNNALCICTIFILVLFSAVYYVENPIKKFLNKYATELFLFQFIFLAIAEKLGWNYWYRMVFVISMDIIVSILVHPIMKELRYLCNRKSLRK